MLSNSPHISSVHLPLDTASSTHLFKKQVSHKISNSYSRSVGPRGLNFLGAKTTCKEPLQQVDI
jgi:hypothetical protein